MPVVWMLVVWGFLGDGIMTRVPVAVVDEDKSSMSREVIRAFDAARAFGLESYENSVAALEAMRNGRVYGVIVVPFAYERDSLTGKGSAVVVYVDENRFAVGGAFEESASAVMKGLKDERIIAKLPETGNGDAGAKRVLNLVHSDFYKIGNMGSSFLIFLGSTLLPGLLMIGATFGCISAILREIYNKDVLAWKNSANGSFSAALLGKLTPHYLYYCLVFLFYIALFSGQGSFAPAGSVFLWFLCGVGAIAAYASACILITAISPTWRLALVVAVGYVAPALPFSGFSIPLDSMDAGVRFYANFIPLTWYIRGQSQFWNLGAEASECGHTFLALALLTVVPIIIAMPFFNRKFSRMAKSERTAAGKP